MNDDEFLGKLNSALFDMGRSMERTLDDAPPPIWVMGLPRSGTTLLTQVLSTGLDVGYINNLIARFWDAPLVGIRLSEMLLGRRGDSNWRSDYGKTTGLGEPHEFSYFWNKLFDYRGEGAFDPVVLRRQVDWDMVRSKIMNLNAAFARPTLYKAMAATFFIPEFDRMFPNGTFVVIDRGDLVDVGCSLANGRMRHHGTLSGWWSIYTDDYEELKKQPYWRQIARQVVYFQTVLEQGLAQVPASRVLRIPYQDLCANPRAVVLRVRELVEASSGWHPNANVEIIPRSFTPTIPKVEERVRKQICDGLLELGVVG